jgi:class 3 adenylate cyclase
MRLPLRAKWTAALLVAAAVPLGSFAYRSLGIQRQGLLDAERQLEVGVVDHAATLVGMGTDEAAEATHRVGQVLTEGSIQDDDARLRLARESMARAELLAAVVIYSPDGRMLDGITRSGAAPTSPAAQLDAAELADGRARWMGTRYLEPVVRSGERRAWVLGVLDLDALGAHLQGLSRDRFEGRPDGVLLLDEAARVLAPAGTGPLAPGTSLEKHDLLGGASLPADPFAHEFAFSGEFTADGGEPMSGTLRALPDHRWAIVVRRSRAAAYVQLAEARRALAVSGVLFALLTALLGTVAAAWTTRPVKRLVELTRAYAARRFGERSPVKTGDELEDLGHSLEQMAGDLSASEVEIARRARVEGDLSRYLPAKVASAIARGEAKLALGGERRAVTVLFADIVSFTPFAEEAPPEQVVALLNELFSVLTEVVFRHEGTVDKFIGDCIMGIFGAPERADDHAQRALAAAEDMHRFVEANAPAWKKAYGIDVRLGIGVNSGEALVGNLGSEARMEYTAIGDVVNVAARLERLAQPGQTLLTSEVVALAGAGFTTAPLGEHPLRGKRQPVQIFELR